MVGARDGLRLVKSFQHVLHHLMAPPALALFVLFFCRWDAVAADGSSSIIALTLPQNDLTAGNEPDGYFPLAKALASMIRLAVEDVNAGGAGGGGSLLEGNLTLSVVGVKTETKAMEGLCNALEAVGENGTFGIVGPILSSQASLLETTSNSFLGLPLVTPSASAARAATYLASGAQGLGAGPSYMFGVQPDVFEQMKALARLILNMKTERDYARGWHQTTERVSLIYPHDAYGPIAASAFVRAARSTIGINVDYNAAGQTPSTIDIASTKPVESAEGTDYRPALEKLKEKDASIFVLLAEGHDGVFVRSVLEQAREVGLVNENTQWYLNGEVVMDGIFTVHDTYHDSELAYDLRGTLGVRACPPIEGPGSDKIQALTKRWEALSSEVYPGAGPGTLTPDGRLDPLLAYTYDAVFALAGGIGGVQTTANAWGSSLRGFEAESCPFKTGGPWEQGETVRSSILEMEFEGITGNVRFTGGENLVSNGAGAAGSGWRDVNGTTFCALNLQAHASLGATFATLLSWRIEDRSYIDDAAGFEMINPLQDSQTYPAGGTAYPFDRPAASRAHFKVVTEEAAVPFAIITGRETKNSDYKGISLDLIKALSDRLGFTYNITVANSSVSTGSLVASVADGTYDIVASWVTINAQRMDSVSFSYPYHSTSLSFAYRVVVYEVSWWHVFRPFESGVWLALFLSTFIVCLMLWVFDGSKVGRSNPNPGKGGRREALEGMGMSTYVTGALLMGQMAHEPYTLESHVLTTGWMFACIVIAASFTAQLASFLSAERQEKRTFVVDDLRNGAISHNQVAVWQGTPYQTFYEQEIMKCNSQQDCYGGLVEESPVLCYSLDECFALVENGTCKTTIVDSITAAYRVANDFCDMAVLSDTFNVEQYGLVLGKDSPFVGDFQQAILGLLEDGTFARIEERYFSSSRCASLERNDDPSASSENLAFGDMRGVFLVYGMFVGVSLVAWLFRRVPRAKRDIKLAYTLQEDWRKSFKEHRGDWRNSFKLRPPDLHQVLRKSRLDKPKGATTSAEIFEDYAVDRKPSGWRWHPTIDRTATRIQPCSTGEESLTGHSVEGSNQFRRSPSPNQYYRKGDEPATFEWEEATKDEE